MTGREALKIVLQKNKVSITEAARRLGTPRTTISTMVNLKNSSITMKSFVDILSVVGYEVLIQPRDGRRHLDDQIIIDEVPEL